jgi:hypothetical protein
MSAWIQSLEDQLAPLQQQIAAHPLINALTTRAALDCFMTHHVFAVWDFVCLLKTLYARIGCVSVPWFPPQDADSVHFLSSILLDEESDQLPHHPERCAHFDLYRHAMQQCGANTQPIVQFLYRLQQGHTLAQALQASEIPLAARRFVESTWAFFTEPTPAIAAAFVFGREAMVPQLFTPLLAQMERHAIPRCGLFKDYLTRHIAIDSAAHYPQALKMLEHLCRDSAEDWRMVQKAAEQALTERLRFLSGIHDALQKEL